MLSLSGPQAGNSTVLRIEDRGCDDMNMKRGEQDPGPARESSTCRAFFLTSAHMT